MSLDAKKCKICGKGFASDQGLHTHLKRVHGISQAEYYHKFFPRKSLFSGRSIIFKNKKDYFSRDFNSGTELRKWCRREPRELVADYIAPILEKRIKGAGLTYAPNHVELMVRGLPGVDIYKEVFGSYSKVCDLLGTPPLFGSGVKNDIFNREYDLASLLIFVDSREQQPLTFKNQRKEKLDFGDYTLAGENYTKTYVDRKSTNDFKSTLSKGNLDRFERELQRAKDFNSYLYILVEDSIEQIIKYNNCSFGGSKKSPHKFQLSYIWHNMRLLQHKFKGNCQFVFSGSRKNSEAIIPILLKLGNVLWDVDLQYYIDRYGINC